LLADSKAECTGALPLPTAPGSGIPALLPQRKSTTRALEGARIPEHVPERPRVRAHLGQSRDGHGTIKLRSTWAMRPCSSGLSKDTHKPTGLHFDFSCAWFRAPGAFPWCLNYIRPPKTLRGVAFEHDGSEVQCSSRPTPVCFPFRRTHLFFPPDYVFPPLLLYLLLGSSSFSSSILHHLLFRQRQPRSASGVSPVANFRLAS
jgi:hypothetical protein